MEKEAFNIFIWACVGALGIACSYYSSSYIASGIVHVSNNHLNLNLNLENVETLVMGSLCFTVFVLVVPNMADSLINILVSNIDYSAYSAAYEASAWANDLTFVRELIQPVSKILGNPDTVSALNSVLQQQQDNWHLLHPVWSKLLDDAIIDNLNIVLVNKINDASIYLPEIFVTTNWPLYKFYRDQGIFYQIPANILIQDGPLIRGLYLTDMLMFDTLNHSIYAENIDLIKGRFITDIPQFRGYLTETMCANIQLLDTLCRVGSGTYGVSPFELAMRTQFADSVLPAMLENHQFLQYVDGSMISSNDIIKRDKIISLINVLTDENIVDKIDLLAAYVTTPEDVILVLNEDIDDF